MLQTGDFTILKVGYVCIPGAAVVVIFRFSLEVMPNFFLSFHTLEECSRVQDLSHFSLEVGKVISLIR